MTAKETILSKIQDQIKILQQAYDSNLRLPDSYFDIIFPHSNGQMDLVVGDENNGTLVPTRIGGDAEVGAGQSGDELGEGKHGKFRRVIREILGDYKRPLTKGEIYAEFKKREPEEYNEKSITWAMSGLSQSGVIRGFKPRNVKMRGQYWGLSEWWEENKLKAEFQIRKSK